MPARSRAESTHSIARCPDEGAADSGAVCRSSFAGRWRRAACDDAVAAHGSRTIHPIGDLHRRGGELFQRCPPPGSGGGTAPAQAASSAHADRTGHDHARRAARRRSGTGLQRRNPWPDRRALCGRRPHDQVGAQHRRYQAAQTVRTTVDRALNRWTSAYFGVAEHSGPTSWTNSDIPTPRSASFSTGLTRPSSAWYQPRRPPRVRVGRRRPGGRHRRHPPSGKGSRQVPAGGAHRGRARAPARFLIIGDGPIRPRLEALCAELQITSSVHFAGARPDVAGYCAGSTSSCSVR